MLLFLFSSIASLVLTIIALYQIMKFYTQKKGRDMLAGGIPTREKIQDTIVIALCVGGMPSLFFVILFAILYILD